jgi:hypothetical protein
MSKLLDLLYKPAAPVAKRQMLNKKEACSPTAARLSAPTRHRSVCVR